jgi:hypothetical protein
MILPRLETQAQRRKLRKPFAELRVHDLMQWHGTGRDLTDRLVGVPGDAMPHATQTTASGLDLGFQPRAHGCTNAKVTAANDASAMRQGP